MAERIKIHTIAHLPEDLVQAWLQHLRDFDVAHKGCHFEVCADMPDKSLPEMIEIIRVKPATTFETFFMLPDKGK
jgi:hypothetical protein